ncbi:MAG: electron transfer flavoprotein subunit alpha/FixB family protein [bacterium]|jgi:electron transfer flavoprotein alpha subunit
MPKVLIVAEHKNGVLKEGTLELLSEARRLGLEPAAVLIGSSVTSLADALAGQGAGTVYLADDASLEVYQTLAYTSAVADAAGQFGADWVWLTSSETGRDLTPRVAARLGAGALSDVISLKLEGDSATAERPCMATKLVETARFKSSGTKVVSIRSGSFELAEASPASANVVALTIPAPDERLQAIGVEVEESNEVSLGDASVVVSVGRGVGNAENVEVVRPLAQQLGAALGASRAVCDAGWLPHKHQVGQTGTQVKPNLYIALGISGAIQHLAGMSDSKTIVAVNKDGDAPIFKIADYGVVGDLFKAVPAMQEQVSKLKS